MPARRPRGNAREGGGVVVAVLRRAARAVARRVRARALLALVLAVLLPASAIAASRPGVFRGPTIRSCCCGTALQTPMWTAGSEARLDRGSPCAFSRCCADDSIPTRLDAVAPLGPEPPLLAAIATQALSPVPAAAPTALRLARPRAPPLQYPSLLLRKQSFLL